MDVIRRHFGEGEEGLAANGGGRSSGKTTITMFAENIGMDTFGIDSNTLAEVETKACGIKKCATTKDASGWEISFLRSTESHDVDGVGNHENECVGSMAGDFGNDGVDDSAVVFGKIETSFSWFLGAASSKNNQIGSGEIFVI